MSERDVGKKKIFFLIAQQRRPPQQTMLLSARRVARLAPAVRSRALSKVVATITGPCNKEALSTFTRAIDGIGGCKLGGSRSMEVSCRPARAHCLSSSSGATGRRKRLLSHWRS